MGRSYCRWKDASWNAASEGGHILVAPHPNDTYKGKCPYHGRCLEGMASGPAIEERWGKKAYELSDKKEVWELEAYYVAQGLVDMIMLLSPERIVLGGGVACIRLM